MGLLFEHIIKSFLHGNVRAPCTRTLAVLGRRRRTDTGRADSAFNSEEGSQEIGAGWEAP